jgi:hypothetical protein
MAKSGSEARFEVARGLNSRASFRLSRRKDSRFAVRHALSMLVAFVARFFELQLMHENREGVLSG